MAEHGRYIVGDWGSTRLRLYLVEHGDVTAEREGLGIGLLELPPAKALLNELQPWISQSSAVEVILGGMASSRNGLQELPYVPAPANSNDWMQGARHLSIGAADVLLATGLQCGDASGGFDVMRGEEAQIFGALQCDQTLRTGSHCLILPGTHTKWVELTESVVTQFRTAITGELYALLREHSSLLKASLPEPHNPERFDLGFDTGAAHGMQTNASVLCSLFRTRTEQLLSARSRSWASGFMSGLLIGHEIATMHQTLPETRPVTIIGTPALASMYQRVFATRGASAVVLDGADCACSGLRWLRDQYI